jgi:DNA-binding transcriptional LysR family regulator
MMISPPITIEALLVLDAIEYRGSYAAAAEQLNKVPSALSYIVQKLEDQLNVTIFERQGRRSVLTPAGKHLLAEGRKVLSAMNTLSEQTQTIANGWETRIRIACDSILDITPVFSGVSRFLEEHQNIEIDIQEEVMNGSWEALIEDRVDLVIGAPAPVPVQKGIRAVKIGELQLVLVAHKTHALAQVSQPVNKQELSKYRTVVVHDSAQTEIARTINIIEGSRHFYVTSLNQKVAAIAAGIGIGYLPKALIERYIANGELITVNLDNELSPQDLFIAWKITNKGKGLFKLRSLLEKHFS